MGHVLLLKKACNKFCTQSIHAPLNGLAIIVGMATCMTGRTQWYNRESRSSESHSKALVNDTLSSKKESFT